MLFSIPDIRLFWTDDARFHAQFKPGALTTFKPYSKYPPCFKDISFWLPDGFVPNDFFELGRSVAGELVEKARADRAARAPRAAPTTPRARAAGRPRRRVHQPEEGQDLALLPHHVRLLPSASP